jgi:polygalacturonase
VKRDGFARRLPLKLGRPVLGNAMKTLLVLVFALVPAFGGDQICRPAATGAPLATTAIQKAIDDCAGKGIVRLDGQAKFVTAPLTLKSHTILEIAPGTTLEGSSDHADYPPMTVLRQNGLRPLLYAKDAQDIVIRGGGIIDGRGESWWPMAKSAAKRPRLIIFDHVTGIVMENVTVQNSPSWTIVPYYSDDVVFRAMQIFAPARDGHNTDGIDPYASRHVLIDHVLIDTGDDNVAIKSGKPNSKGPDRPSEDIRIVDCIFRHGHGLSIGSELAGGAKNVVAERISFDGTDQGIRIKSGRDRGNDVGGFVFRDITMKNVGTAILLTMYYGAPKHQDGSNTPVAPVTALTPRFHDITIENVNIESAKKAILIDGLPESPIQSVHLKNVTITAETGAVIRHAAVRLENVTVHAAAGEDIAAGPGAAIERP